MSFVNDQRVIFFKEAIMACLSEEDTVCHELDHGIFGELGFETVLVSHTSARLFAELFCHASRHGKCRQSAGLCTADHAAHATSGLECNLRKLRSLA